MKKHNIDSMAMESTGVYWIPIYQIFESYNFEQYRVNARHVKNVPGRKTDVKDSQWLQYLNTAQAFRLSALSLNRSNSYLGDFYRKKNISYWSKVILRIKGVSSHFNLSFIFR